MGKLSGYSASDLRDAAKALERASCALVLAIQFRKGRTSPCPIQMAAAEAEVACAEALIVKARRTS